MSSHKRISFSANSKYFACVSHDDKLLIWEIFMDLVDKFNAFIDCKFDSSVYTACSSLHWITVKHKQPSPKKTKLTSSHPSENQLLAVGTVKGDILIYNVSCKNLYLHLVGRHSDAINDMCFYNETDSFFTCSSDKSIAVWDISTGKQKLKWKAGDDPISSICVIDENNMLSSSTSVTWWNISEKTAIKKFSGHSTEIFKLLTVNAVSLNSCYFLSAAASDVKIKAWSLSSNECETSVASFVLSEQLNDLDISKASSKDKPLILSAVTKDGFFHIFEHVLNGNVNQPILPKLSQKITPKSPNSTILCLKLSPDSESCIVAVGSNKDNMIFKHINVKKSLRENLVISKTLINKSQDSSPVVMETSIIEKNVLINGLKSSSKCSENTPQKTQLESAFGSYRRKLRSSSIGLFSTDSERLNIPDAEDSKTIHRGRNHVKVTNTKGSKRSVDLLIKGLQTGNEDIINAVFHTSDTELIKKYIEDLSSNNLKLVLEELNSRFCHHSSYSPVLSKWLKEISKMHITNIIQSEDTRQVLHNIAEYVNSLNIHKTISKMSSLQGLLTFTTQISSSEESSESEEPPEL